MTQKTYKPVRDRGVYRAAANPLSTNHKWALELVTARGFTGLMRWVYRDKGYKSLLADLLYCENPLLTLVKKPSWSEMYTPVPIRTKS